MKLILLEVNNGGDFNAEVFFTEDQLKEHVVGSGLLSDREYCFLLSTGYYSEEHFSVKLYLEYDVESPDEADEIFDVARWSRDDIKGRLECEQILLIEQNYKSLESFIDDVIDTLSCQFDAENGINWDAIDYAVDELLGALQ